jgi:hypothetical protein
VGHKGVIIPLDDVTGSPVAEPLKTNSANVKRSLIPFSDAGVIAIPHDRQDSKA